MARLILRASFLRDLDVRLAWLEEHAPEEWLEAFREGLESVKRRISAYPRSGTPLKKDARLVLRAKAFPHRLPYLVYYVHPERERIDVAYLLRLFHFRQRRRPPRLHEWPS